MTGISHIDYRRVGATQRVVGRYGRYPSPTLVLVAAEALIAFAVVCFFLTGDRATAVDYLGSRADIAMAVAAVAFAGLLHRALPRRVWKALDRRLSRQPYDEQRILADLGHAARAVTTREQLFGLVVNKIQDALHASNVSIFVRDDASGEYVCEISSPPADADPSAVQPGPHPAPLPALARDAFVVRRLSRLLIPLTVDAADYEAWARAFASAPSTVKGARRAEGEALRRIKAALLVPITIKDQLVGVMSLGPRPAGQPFSPADKRLLLSVAGQMAFIIENAKLVQRITEEERLRRELEIASEVQRRLFPESAPELPSLELTGYCKPARGVGGDYYDFLTLDDDRLGIAVADVAGKGISAALLMSIVQASLRSQAASAKDSLTDLVATLNQLLHRSTGPGSYATFFYAQFEERTRRLTYVNAGHNPPLLLRAGGSPGPDATWTDEPPATRARANGAGSATAVLEMAPPTACAARLTAGGPVLGVLRHCAYEQETIQMRSGDILVAYTDGLTEAMNLEGEEFGEWRLEQVLAASAHLPADELRETIVRHVRDWSGGAPQHDDLTFVVLKVK